MGALAGMAAGIAVVASRAGGVPELIKQEMTGLVCEPARPETSRAAVRRLLADPALRFRLGAAARQDALNRFYPKVIAKQHLAIYRTLQGSSRKAGSGLPQPIAS